MQAFDDTPSGKVWVKSDPGRDKIMDILAAILCDSAADYAGKLCIMGAFDSVLASSFPAVQPHCSLALRIVFRKEEEGTHRIIVHFVDEDGVALIPALDTTVEVGLPEDVYFLTRNLILNIQGMRVEKPGLYSVDIIVDGRAVVSIPLQVRQIS